MSTGGQARIGAHTWKAVYAPPATIDNTLSSKNYTFPLFDVD